jgi:hypothetical protein
MEQGAFQAHVIAYLVKLEIEVRALRLALLRADEPLVTGRSDDDISSFGWE